MCSSRPRASVATPQPRRPSCLGTAHFPARSGRPPGTRPGRRGGWGSRTAARKRTHEDPGLGPRAAEGVRGPRIRRCRIRSWPRCAATTTGAAHKHDGLTSAPGTARCSPPSRRRRAPRSSAAGILPRLPCGEGAFQGFPTGFSYQGENLVMMAPVGTVRQMFAMWLASPGHRANILAPPSHSSGCISMSARPSVRAPR